MFLIWIVMLILTIISFIYYKINKKFVIVDRKKGVYRCAIPIDDKTYEVTCEIELNRDYGDGDVSITYNKIYGLPKDLGDAGVEILINDFSIVSETDIVWD